MERHLRRGRQCMGRYNERIACKVRFYDGLSIDEPSLSARVTSIQPASLRSSKRCALPYSHGRKRLAEWLQYQVQSGPMQPVASAIWPAFWDRVSSRI